MKSLSLTLALLASATLALAVTTQTKVLFEEDFESLNLGPMLGQRNSKVMYSTVNGINMCPTNGVPSNTDTPGLDGTRVANEIEVVEETPGGNKCLLVIKMKNDVCGLTTDEGKKDRGVSIPLDWGDINYFHGSDSRFIITGKYYGPHERGYAELRLGTQDGEKTIPVFRFSPYSSDYLTYIYQTANYSSSWYDNSVNKDDTRICLANRNQMPVAQAYREHEWVNFEIVIEAEQGYVESFKVWDDNGFSYENNVRCKLALSKRPDYIEFTAVGNNNNTNRHGACFDDIKVVYETEIFNYVETFNEDFSTYEVGDSIFDVAPQYTRIGSAECMSGDIYDDPTHGHYVKLWMQNPGAGEYPKDGLIFPFTPSMQCGEGARFVLAADVYVPDNGCWSKVVDADGNTLSTVGYHTAGKWFYTFDGSDSDNLYELGSHPHISCWYTIAQVVDIVEGKPVLESTFLADHGHDSDTRAYGYDWYKSYGIELAANPAGLALQVQGWPEKEVRWLSVGSVTFGYVAPEPGLLALLGLAGLAFLRRK